MLGPYIVFACAVAIVATYVAIVRHFLNAAE